MKTVVRGLLAGAALIASANASAQTIVDTGTPANPYSGYSLGWGQLLAGSFTLDHATTLASIQGWIGSDGGEAIIGVAGDAGGLPGATLFSGSFTLNDSGWQGLNALDWDLGPGTYWATFAFVDDFGILPWMPSSAGNPLQSYAIRRSGAGWTTEYGPLDLGVRITEGTISPVPEPAAWGLMIGGFGLAGMALRRRVRVRYAAA
ncbi:PEPxxWA-CTERM sorting domain-containing protein [Sphingomonas sp. dw_22]|uniref:PEPxxWA-CTERM sorting domain-containing protein n=1 Tax=Sphingomonas sp. dw_22 TaxID=2721175 RepID=UPI002115F25A|nr:PEPxxWA-CTERM sorting domain-containing protein [Sphingomonas sp. dw_22]